MPHYLDTSALVKLVVAETETPALRAWLDDGDRTPLASAGLRSLDAIHLAAALDLGDDLDSIVTYDDRLADAARLNGISVAAPS